MYLIINNYLINTYKSEILVILREKKVQPKIIIYRDAKVLLMYGEFLISKCEFYIERNNNKLRNGMMIGRTERGLFSYR